MNICSAPTCWLLRCSRKPANGSVYLPPGKWIDYQTGNIFDGARWHDITAGDIPIVLLVKDNSVLPHVKPAQSTSEIDWNDIELRVFSTNDAPVTGRFALPNRRSANN